MENQLKSTNAKSKKFQYEITKVRQRHERKKKVRKKAENFWKPKATMEMKANESKFARLNQTP